MSYRHLCVRDRDYVTAFEKPCGDDSADLIVPSSVSDDSPTFGPEDRLPIVEGVWYCNPSQKVTIEVDGRSYGPLNIQRVEATPESSKDPRTNSLVTQFA